MKSSLLISRAFSFVLILNFGLGTSFAQVQRGYTPGQGPGAGQAGRGQRQPGPGPGGPGRYHGPDEGADHFRGGMSDYTKCLADYGQYAQAHVRILQACLDGASAGKNFAPIYAGGHGYVDGYNRGISPGIDDGLVEGSKNYDGYYNSGTIINDLIPKMDLSKANQRGSQAGTSNGSGDAASLFVSLVNNSNGHATVPPVNYGSTYSKPARDTIAFTPASNDPYSYTGETTYTQEQLIDNHQNELNIYNGTHYDRAHLGTPPDFRLRGEIYVRGGAYDPRGDRYYHQNDVFNEWYRSADFDTRQAYDRYQGQSEAVAITTHEVVPATTKTMTVPNPAYTGTASTTPTTPTTPANPPANNGGNNSGNNGQNGGGQHAGGGQNGGGQNNGGQHAGGGSQNGGQAPGQNGGGQRPQPGNPNSTANSGRPAAPSSTQSSAPVPATNSAPAVPATITVTVDVPATTRDVTTIKNFNLGQIFQSALNGGYQANAEFAYNQAYLPARNDGYNAGRTVGRTVGDQLAHQQARRDAYNSYFKQREAESYKDGFQEGHRTGYQATYTQYRNNPVPAIQLNNVVGVKEPTYGILQPNEGVFPVFRIKNYGGVKHTFTVAIRGDLVNTAPIAVNLDAVSYLDLKADKIMGTTPDWKTLQNATFILSADGSDSQTLVKTVTRQVTQNNLSYSLDIPNGTITFKVQVQNRSPLLRTADVVSVQGTDSNQNVVHQLDSTLNVGEIRDVTLQLNEAPLSMIDGTVTAKIRTLMGTEVMGESDTYTFGTQNRNFDLAKYFVIQAQKGTDQAIIDQLTNLIIQEIAQETSDYTNNGDNTKYGDTGQFQDDEPRNTLIINALNTAINAQFGDRSAAADAAYTKIYDSTRNRLRGKYKGSGRFNPFPGKNLIRFDRLMDTLFKSHP